MVDSDEEYYQVPIKDQKFFGAGIKRKRIHFVPSSSSVPTTPASADGTTSRLSASERYLSVVLGGKKPKAGSEPPVPRAAVASSSPNHAEQELQDGSVEEDRTESKDNDGMPLCGICMRPLGDVKTHASSLVHQICLPHTHPPSALDRTRKGIDILQLYGWDPDARRGLGATGREGILHPVKAIEKRDTAGLGLRLDEDEEARIKRRRKPQKPPQTEVKKLDAGGVRKMEKEMKKRDEKLRNMFYSNEDVDRYLGGG